MLLAPHGSRALTLILHIGPGGGTAHVRVGANAADLTLSANETRTLDFELPPDAAWVPISVEASSAFRPSDVDSQSGDHRLLGAQVRVVLR